MIGRITGVTAVQDTAHVNNVSVFRSPLIPSIDTNALTVQAASLGLLQATGDTVAEGSFLKRRPPPESRSRCSAPWPPSASASTGSSPESASGSAASGSTSPES